MSKRLIRSQWANRAIEEPVVNLTPLIDVVFVILIMFIVVAPLLELDRIELAHSSSSFNPSASVQESGPISIHVNRDNSVWMNSRRVTMAELSENLKKAKAKHPGVRPQIFHDRRAEFGTYQSIKNAVEAAGFEQMDIILKPA